MHTSSASRTARTCVFCGRPADSREHLFSDWMHKVLPSQEPMLHFRQLGKDGATRREWARRPFRDKVRFVCCGCNGGWMSDLEKYAAPLLRAPMTKTPCAFDLAQQRILATWAVKTSLVFQASQMDAPIAPRQHFAHLRERRSPPHQVTVWLGSHYRAREDPANSVFLQRPLRFESEDGRLEDAQLDAAGPGYLNFLAVGGISFVLVGHRFADRISVDYRGHLADGLIRIWPNSAATVAWPPQYMMDQDLIESITLPPSGFIATVWPADR
jgi:hypothetical protein